jgi:hypothetical protein
MSKEKNQIDETCKLYNYKKSRCCLWLFMIISILSLSSTIISTGMTGYVLVKYGNVIINPNSYKNNNQFNWDIIRNPNNNYNQQIRIINMFKKRQLNLKIEHNHPDNRHLELKRENN